MEEYADEIDSKYVKQFLKNTVRISGLLCFIITLAVIVMNNSNYETPCSHKNETIRSAGQVIFGDSYWLSKPFIFIIFFVTIFGWYGLLRNYSCLIVLYAILKLLVLVLFTLATLSLFSFNNHAIETIEENVDDFQVAYDLKIEDFDKYFQKTSLEIYERNKSISVKPSFNTILSTTHLDKIKMKELLKMQCKMDNIFTLNSAKSFTQFIFTIVCFLLFVDVVFTIVYTFFDLCNCQEGGEYVKLEEEKKEEAEKYAIINGEVVPCA